MDCPSVLRLNTMRSLAVVIVLILRMPTVHGPGSRSSSRFRISGVWKQFPDEMHPSATFQVPFGFG
jgi:hypothetical protein